MAEGRERVERALRLDASPTAERARALTGASMLAVDCADADAARTRGEEALSLYRELGDRWGAAYALFALGFSETYVDWELARQRFAEAAELFAELGDEWQTLDVRRRLSWAYEELGETERARELREENLALARESGNRLTEAATLGQLARQYAIPERRLDDAAEMIGQAARIHREIGDQWGPALDIGTLARILAAKGDAGTAVQLLGCEHGLEEEMEFSEPWFTEFNAETQAAVRDRLGEAAFAEAWDRGRTLTADEAVALAFRVLARLSAAPRAGT
jgi:non-specific serine/threonine protein kinase